MGKKVKVVFDSNVWISIFMRKVLAQDFSKVIDQQATVYVTQEIMIEISKVLVYPRITQILQASDINPKTILRHIAAASTVIKPKIKIRIIEEDPEDNKILECASAAGADFIVTGDKNLLKLGNFEKTRILSPRQFLDHFP
jgi:putative PIN family toxin of toxin-antitoxin system